MIKRLNLLTKRVKVAATMGVPFYGTSSFALPQEFKVKGQKISLQAPHEEGLAYDFINVILDDEYGLRNVKDNPLKILDIGGNIGLFSIHAAMCFPDAEIHSYEPNPSLHTYIQQNLEQVGATFYPEAVGSSSGEIRFQSEGESRLGITGGDEGLVVPMVSFEQTIERIGGEVDLLKLDCEGAEWEIFSATEAFKRVRAIRMEYHLDSRHNIQDLKTAAKRINFDIIHLEENSNFGIAWLIQNGNS